MLMMAEWFSLTLLTWIGCSWVCDECELRVKANDVKERYHCHDCLFDLCEDCYARFKLPEMMHPAGTGDNRE